ncbi:Sensor histidine kinase DesK [Sporotomaculum syntrophicum]|uniref:histidine kinase n=1 Tax=Sporotomaculum syntrophicum TaxID=182264 RepID=A0A9D2WRN9_9FIRM|nr:sensor histidine kinase [Sporotomaculum syntrophicum]KAF1086199.1 Sensor histidine kinase DesK [Sporotomaculum syntrophicum]
MYKRSFLQEVIYNAIIMKERIKESAGFYMSEQPRAWQWLDFLLAMVRAGWFFILVIVFITDPDHTGMSFYIILIWLLVAFIVPQLFWRPGTINTVLYPLAELVCTGGLQVYISLILHKDIFVLAVPLLTTGYFIHKKNLWLILTFFILLIPLANLAFPGSPWTDILLAVLQNLLMLALGYIFRRMLNAHIKMKQLLRENERQYQLIQEQNQMLVAYAKQVEELTQLEERNRMARELHDTVGHTFTSVIMGMDAVSYLIDTAPDVAREKLDVLRQVARNGLAEVRRSIHEIAPKGQELPLSQHIARITNEFSLHTGASVGIHIEGEVHDEVLPVKMTLIRCIQESLTNALRHGQAKNITINLKFTAGEIILSIEDDGVGADGLKPGFGLSSMQQRLAALHGTLEYWSEKGKGTRITCLIPTGR